jgi:ribosomal protein S12 methylthiotransferase
MKGANRVDIVSLGCSKNLVDSEFLAKQLELSGYKVQFDPKVLSGRIVVVNTCGFIGDAKEESINAILEYVEAKKNGMIDKLFVMGCLSERYADDLALEIPEVDKFYGKFAWKDILADLGQQYQEQYSIERSLSTPAHYAYVKIAEGCNQHCAYCAIPIITGRYKSRPMEEITAEVEWLVSQGVKEFQIIAQDLTSYGKDLYGEYNIAELVEKISDIDGVEWIRLHYAYPTHFPYDLLRVIRERKNVCKYLDIALQHINNDVLKSMKRRITKQETLDLIERVRKEVPGICLRTTLMVGFPGETESQFAELCDFVREVRFDRMGAFQYCEEDGTPAAKLEDDVLPEEKLRRYEELMMIQENIMEDLNAQKVGKVFKVVIDGVDDGYYVGRTEFDSPDVDSDVLIAVDEKELEIGAFYEVRITDSECLSLYGTVVGV